MIYASVSGTVATYNSQSDEYNKHQYETILDAQSQVSIANKHCDLISNIRRSKDTLTLHGMGKGSLFVDHVADHVVLGVVWYHPEASINVWQFRATELACNVSMIKKTLPEFNVKVTTAFVAKTYATGIEYRFEYCDNLYILEGRH